MRVAIVGAGAGGLSVAWSLARAGIETHVFDAGAPGASATWASAGMLTPWQYDRPEPLQRACAEAALLWPGFERRLEESSGVSVAYAANGVIRIARNDIEAQSLRNRAARLAPFGARAAALDPIPPFLTQAVTFAMHFPGEGAVDNRLLGNALAAAVRGAGGHVYEGEPVGRILIVDGKVVGVETTARRLACDVAVIAAGAWSAGIEGLPPEVRPPVTPRKGQILAVDAKGRAVFAGLHCPAQGYYAVPRDDGRVIVGATLEDTGFNAQTGRQAIQALRAWLVDVVIGADEWPVIEAWAGLRPGTPDNAPILGPSPVAGLHFATGQFRDGILLAPWIADWVSAGVLSGQTPAPLEPFSIARFQGAQTS